MGRFLDEPQKTYKGKFLDEEPTKPLTPKGSPAFGGAKGLRTLLTLGPSAYGGVPGSEDVLPMAGQIAGSAGGFGGSVAGATIGQGARQAIKDIRGTRDSQPRRLFGVGPTAPGIVNDLAGEAAGTATMEGLGRGLSKLAEPVANRLMNSVIKPARNILKRNPRFGLDALDAGITGSRPEMISKSGDLIESGEDALSAVLKGKSGSVDVSQIAKELDSLKAPFENAGDDASVAAIQKVQDHLASKGSIGLEEANQLKRDLYKVIKDNSYGKGIGELPAVTSARKQGASGIKRGIEKIAPEVGPINKKIGVSISAKDALENEMANSQKRVLLPKLAAMGAGGLTLAGNPMAAAGVMIGDKAVDFLRSPWMVTGAAKNIMRARSLAKPFSVLASEGVRRLRG